MAVTLQMDSRTHSADSPGLMMVNTGWSFGRHTQDGVSWSGTHMSLSVLGRVRPLTFPSSLFFQIETSEDSVLVHYHWNGCKFASLNQFVVLNSSIATVYNPWAYLGYKS